MSKRKKTYIATAQAVCKDRKGWTSSTGLTTVQDIHAASKRGAELIAKRTWRERGELPIPGMRRRASCKLYTSVEEI